MENTCQAVGLGDPAAPLTYGCGLMQVGRAVPAAHAAAQHQGSPASAGQPLLTAPACLMLRGMAHADLQPATDILVSLVC